MDFKEAEILEAKAKELDKRIRDYIRESKDAQFTEYLQKLLGRINARGAQVDILADELERSHQMYVNRMRIAGVTCEPVHQETVQNETETVHQESVQQEAETVHQETVQTNESSRYFEYTDDFTTRVPMTDSHTTQAHNVSSPSGQSQPVQPQSVQPQTVPMQPQSRPIYQQPAGRTQKSSLEFVIGTALLSIVGGAFILTAIVLLGKYYMTGFVKGMCLFGGALLLMLLSELVLYRKWPKLGTVFTAIAICGLYLSNILNHLTYENYNNWIAMGIVTVITIGGILLSKKRDSFLYRGLALIIGLFSLILTIEDYSMLEVGILIGISLLINVMSLCLPMQRRKTGARILHMYAATIYTVMFNVCIYEELYTELPSMIAAACALLIVQIIFVVQVLYQRREADAGHIIGRSGIATAYFISGLLLIFALPEYVVWNETGTYFWMRHGYFLVITLLTFATMWMVRRSKEISYPYICLAITALAFYSLSDYEWENVICITALLIITKLIAFIKNNTLKVCDAVFTILACIVCLSYAAETGFYAAVLVAALIISVLFIRYWQTYFEIIITFTLAVFAVAKLPTVLELQAFVGIMFVGILIFNNINRWQGKGIRVFNYLALASQIICFLILINPIYRNAYIVYLCMLIFGLATIVVTFQEKYKMDFRHKNLILAFFLTYMAFVIRTDYPVINSILLMLIALICVAIGFISKEKEIRIYGLVLSLIICVKIALYDFFDTATLQKVILFLVVGIIALVIASIYIVLEKKYEIQQSE